MVAPTFLPDTDAMRVLGFGSLFLALSLLGCGGDLAPLTAPDLSSPAVASSDMLSAGDDALLPIGQPCTIDAQCQTNVCFVGGMRSFCTLHCTMATAAQDCPVPLTSGQCNMQGFCKP